MAAPSELSIEEIRNFIVSRGGKVTNHDLVKQFKKFLTDPQHKDTARETFKKYVNIIGSIQNENGQKYIVLKKKKTPTVTPEQVSNKSFESLTFSPSSSFQDPQEAREPPPYVPPPAVLQPIQNLSPQQSVQAYHHQDIPPRQPEHISKQETCEPVFKQREVIHSTDVNYREQDATYRQPEPPYRQETIPKHEFREPVFMHSDHIRSQSFESPEVLTSVRRESIDSNVQHISERKASLKSVPSTGSLGIPDMSDNVLKKQRDNMIPDNVDASYISLSSPPLHVPSVSVVKRQKKHLENIAPQEENDEANLRLGFSIRSESSRSLNSDCEPVSVKERLERFNKFAVDGDHSKRPSVKKGSEDEDQGSVLSINQHSHEWIVKASAANYQALAKMLNDDPKLVKVRDPVTNALHWAAKHGNEDIIKLCAGKCPELSNYKSNGGYTPLHLAMQFRNEGIYNLLIHVYGADRDIRDHSGRKARQYHVNEDTSISPDTFRRIMGKKKQSDQRFLRIGSLNLRVKKTTHAFSNFLGVGTGHKIKNTQNLKLGKLTSWGSADDIQDDNNKMPPPQCSKVKRKIAKKSQENFASKSRSTPSTPNQPRSLLGSETDNISPSPSSSTLHDSDSDTACGFDAQWQEKGSNK